jgi:hypothetical protein
MSDKQTFEDIIQSKLSSETQFSFDEENWEEAEEMITSFRKKEKIKKGTFLFLSGFVLGIIIMWPFINKTENASQSISQTPESIVKQKSISEEQKQPDTISLSLPTKTNRTNTSHVRPNQVAEPNSKTYSDLIVSTTKEKNYSTTKTKQRILAHGFKLPSAIAEITNAAHEQTINKIQKESKENSKSNKNLITSNDSSITIDSDNALAVLPIDSITKNTVAVIKKDSAAKLILDKEKANSEYSKSLQLYVFVGGNYLKGGTVNPIQGFELIKPITEHWAAGTGVNYTLLNINSNNAVKTIITNTTYDFGYTSDVVQIKTNDLHYIVVPVFAQYTINEKNSVIVGVNNYMLFTVSNNYSTYQESYGNKQNVTSGKTFGYSGGFNPYDIGILIGYKRKLFHNISIAMYMNYGLRNIKKNGYYTDNTFERNVSGQMMLIYRLR